MNSKTQALATTDAPSELISMTSSKVFEAVLCDGFLRNVLDSLTDLVYFKDADSRYIFSNLAHARSLGMASPADVIGKTVFDFFPPELAQKYHNDDLQVVTTGEEVTVEYEPRTNADGKARVYRRTKRPLRDENGHIVGIVVIARDTTEHYESQKELRILHETFEQQLAERTAAAEDRARELSFQKFALDQSAIVAITDARGRITHVNDKFCEISGYSRDELVGQDHRMVNSGLHPKEFFKQMYATIASGRVWHGEIRNRAKSGSFYWVDTTIVPMVDKANGRKITGFVAIRQDITLHKKALEHLQTAKEIAEAASYAKGEFLANMSHEIRTPMTAIIGYADLLSESGRSQAERVEFVQTIRRNGEHLLKLINDLLDLSKVEAGKFQIEVLPCKLCQILGDLESGMRVRAINKGIAFSIECDSDTPKVFHSDPTRLRQILLNLLNNAIKFTDSGGVHVRVSAHAGPKKMIRFDVIDTGIGLTPEQQQVLYKPFAQADNSTTRRFGGTGLGLALSKQLVEILGGKLSLVSEPNKGSTFSVTIPDLTSSASTVPRKTTGLARTRKSVEDQDSSPDALDGRILLVEDGADNRRLVTIYLEAAGLTVHCASNGHDAVEMVTAAVARHEPFDVIMMDMQMPVMDGYQATAELRRLGFVEVPIVAFTAHAFAGEREKCIAAGCDDYSTKPINPKALLRTIAKQLHRVRTKPRTRTTAVIKKASRAKTPTTPNEAVTPPATEVPHGLQSEYRDNKIVQRVLPKFIADLPTHVASMWEMLESDRLDDLRRLIHQMKGSGGGYGFPAITQLAAMAEASIDAHEELARIETTVKDLSNLIRSVDGYEAAREEKVNK